MGVEGNRLGELLVSDNLITQMQLDHALQIHKEQEDRQRLGEVLVDLGYLTRRKLRYAVKRHGKHVLFGELLVDSGAISPEQLEEALSEQTARGGAIGEVLVEQGLLDEDQLSQALGHQLDIPYVVPQPRLVDMALFDRLTPHFMQAHSVVPLFETDGVVTVVLANPGALDAIYTLEDTFGRNLELAICSKTRVDATVESLLRQKQFGADRTHDEAASRGGIGERLVIEGDSAAQYAGGGARGVFDYLIYNAIEERASDIHIEPGRESVRVRYRIDGVLLFRTEFPPSVAAPLAMRAKALANLDISSANQQQEGRITARVDGQEVDLRVTICRTVYGDSLSIRIFSKDSGLMDLDDLGMLPEVLASFRRLDKRSSGLTLFVGPTGAGKTTSLYATLNHLSDGSRKIVTVESPVEFLLEGAVQRDLPSGDEAAVTAALRSALHQDPDVVALGEIGSNETASALLESALMGHRVFATLHADDAASALVRLGDIESAASFLSSCSMVLVAQRLVRRLCPNCKEVRVPAPAVLEGFEVRDFDADSVDFYSGAGCPECLGTGYRSRTGIFEMATVGPDMRELLLSKPSAGELRNVLMQAPGFVSLKHAGFLKAMEGVTSLEDVLRVAPGMDTEAAEGDRMTLKQLCRRGGVVLEGSLQRQADDLA